MQQAKSTTELYVYADQVSGKQPKLLIADSNELLKGYNERQSNFYCTLKSLHISHSMACLQKHVPKYLGQLSLDRDPLIILAHNKAQKNSFEWLSHLTARYKKRNVFNRFIVLQNFTHDYELPNILDIKVGGRNVEGKLHKITESVSKYYVKLNGCKINYGEQRKSVFLSKYYLKEKKTIEEMVLLLGLFFYDRKSLAVEAIVNIRNKLADLILSFKAVRGFKFISSSLCLFFDAGTRSKGDVKFLDFGRVSECSLDFFDAETCAGMENVYTFLGLVLERSEILLLELPKLKQFYIPQYKKQRGLNSSQLCQKEQI